MKNPLLRKLAPIRIFHNLHNLLLSPQFIIPPIIQYPKVPTVLWFM